MAAPVPPLSELRRIEWRGLPVVIETEAGAVREWTRPDGSIGRTRIDLPYGYIEGVEGSDGDELDCYVGRDPEAKFVYVVHQLTPAGKRDEDKCFLDVATAGAAESFFLQHRDDGDAAYGGMSAIPVDAFLAKLKRRTGTGKIRHGRMGTTMPVRSFHGIAGADLRGFAGRVQAFDALDATGNVRVGVWDRFATFGEGDQGLKVKEGEAVAFNPETFAKMVDNWAARGQQLTMCLDHRSALGGIVEAPAAALYDAIAVVGEDGKTLHIKSVYGKTIAAPDAATLIEQCAKYPPPLSQPGGMWGYRAEITPKGLHPTEGLANFRGISPLFVMNGVDEQERPIGPVLFDVAAVNVNFQGGCELTLGALTSLVRMSAAESALHDAAPIGEKKPEDKVTTMAGQYQQTESSVRQALQGAGINPDSVVVQQSGRVVAAFFKAQADANRAAEMFRKWGFGVEVSHDGEEWMARGTWTSAMSAMGNALAAATSMALFNPGDRVKVRTVDGGTATGTVSHSSADGVSVTWDAGTPKPAPGASIEKMSAAPGATAMATVADLNIGDRVRNAKTGNAGTVTEKKPDGSAHVKWEGADGDGWFYPGAPLPPEISKMSAASNGATAMAKFNPGDKAKISDSYPTANARGQEVTIGRSEPWSPTGEEAYWVNDGLTNRWVRAVDLVKMSAAPSGNGAVTMAYPSKVGDEGAIERGEYYPLRTNERVRVIAISDSGRRATVESTERPGVQNTVPIAAIQMSAPTAMGLLEDQASGALKIVSRLGLKQPITASTSGNSYTLECQDGGDAQKAAQKLRELGDKVNVSGNAVTVAYSRMSATLGASGAVEGAKSMNPEMMKKMGFADGAQPTVDEKMSKFAAHAMGEASPEDCKAMADDLDKHEEPAAKAMAVKLRKMAAVEPHAEPDGDELHKMAEAADLKPVGMSRTAIFTGVRERLVAMRATTVPREDVKILKDEIATLKQRNAAADEAECDGAIVAFARGAIADGRWDPDGQEALVALARASVDTSKAGKAKAAAGTAAAEKHLKQKGFWTAMSNFTANGHPIGKGHTAEDFTSGNASVSAAEVEYKAEIAKVMDAEKVSHTVAMSRVAKAKPQLIAALRK